MRRPLFQALSFGVIAGSRTLGMICTPCRPPTPYISTALTTDLNTVCNGSFAFKKHLSDAAWAKGRYEPKLTVFCAAANGCFHNEGLRLSESVLS